MLAGVSAFGLTNDRDAPVSTRKDKEHVPVIAKNADEVRKLLKESSVDSIKCIDAGITEKDAAQFSEILRSQHGQSVKCSELFLGANEINSEGVIKLMEAMKFKVRLRKLDLGANDICRRGAEEIAEVLKLPQCDLVMLNLSYNRIEDEGANKIGDAIKARAGSSSGKDKAEPLRELNLRMNAITADGLSICDALREPSCHIASLNLSGNHLGDAGGERLADALKWNTTLCFLDVSGTIQEPNVGAKGIEHIAHVLRMPNPSRQLSGGDLKQDNFNLQHLNLSYNDIDDEIGSVLAQELRFNYKLKHLVLKGNLLADAAGKAFAEMMCLNSVLKDIDLSQNFLGFAAGLQLAEMMKVNKGLMHVNLSGNKIGGKYAPPDKVQPGDKFAEAIFKCKSLNSLNLGGCGFLHDEEQKIFAEVKKKEVEGATVRVNVE
mmetsp:Transcript_80240/g.126542  ORF Transcript_80240/g.126542 Transcript_80240/m.126542 type:complete len:434 (+) Transcript_80240:56-1357(+)